MCTVTVLGILALYVTPLGTALARRLIAATPPASADFILVLGGAGERAVEGARLYREGYAPRVIFSSRDEDADHLAAIAKAYGVPDQAIIIDHLPHRTVDHPRTVAHLAGIDPATTRLLIVTSTFHTARSLACFRKAGYRQVRITCPQWRVGGAYGPRMDQWRMGLSDLPPLVYEYLAWGYYRLRGWL